MTAGSTRVKQDMTGRGGVLRVVGGVLAPLLAMLLLALTAVAPAHAGGGWGISISDSPDPVAPGGDITYTVSVFKTSGESLNSDDKIDVGLTDVTFVSLSAPAGWFCSTPAVTATGTISCRPTGTLNNSPHVFALTANAGTDPAPTRSVTANLTSSADPDISDNTRTAVTAVAGETTTTALTSSVNPSLNGQVVTFTATVFPQSGFGDPLGSVQFYDGPNPVGPPVVVDEGQASYPTGALAPGIHPIRAQYSGGGGFGGSTSATLDQEVLTTAVTPEPTTTSLSQSVVTSFAGEPVSFTAIVTSAAGIPEGVVTFFDGAFPLGTVSLDVGEASIDVALLPNGIHNLIAIYTSSNSAFDNSASGSLGHEIKARIQAAVGSSSSPSVVGETVTLSATLSVDAPGSGSPTGAVDFYEGSAFLGQGVLSGGVATVDIAFASAGAHSVTAEYAGDVGFAPAVSPAFTQNVGPAATDTAVTAPGSSIFGQPVTFTATVVALSPGGGTPSGNVQFFDGAIPLGIVPLDSSGEATFTTSALPVGGHSISVAYLGSSDHTGSSSAPAGHMVEQTMTTLDISGPATSVMQQPVTFTATVTPMAPGAGTPTGTVTFIIGGIGPLPPVPLAGGMASVTVTFPVSDPTPYPVIAQYSGDTNFLDSSSNFDHTVSNADTTTALSASASQSITGELVTFTATVAPIPPGGGTPGAAMGGGEVTFYIDGEAQTPPVSVCCGTATFNTSSLSIGTHTIGASFDGSFYYNGSVATAISHTVTAIPTTTTVTASPPNPNYGQSVSFTVAVTPTGHPGPVTGMVDLEVDDESIGTVPLDTNGEAFFTSSQLTGGIHRVVAHYLGEADFAASDSTPLDLPVGPDDVDVALTVSPSPTTVYGEEVTVTATVTPRAGQATPTGLVRFISSNDPVDVILSDGVAIFSTNDLPVGEDEFIALYAGEQNYLGNVSNIVEHEVLADATTTTVTSSAANSTYGQNVTFTVTVAGATAPQPPGGTVTVSGLPGGTQTLTLANGSASVSTSQLAIGSHTISASFATQGNFTGSSGSVVQNVAIVGTTTALTSSQNPSVPGQTVTFTATVSGVSGQPEGSMVFSIDGTAQPAVALSAGTATLATSALAVGTHTVVASYSGSATHSAGAPASLTQTVNTHATTTTLTSSLNPSKSGQPVTFTATVSSAGGTPGGSVVFSIDGTAQPAVALSGGSATLATSALATGSHSIVAAYDGSTDFANSTSAPLTQTVDLHTTATQLVSSLNPSKAGEAVTFTATVTSTGGTPGGSVVFTVDGTAQPAATLAGGSATFVTSALSAGPHAIVAAYTGSTDFAASTSASLTQTVDLISTTTLIVSSLNPSKVGQAVTFTATVTTPGGTPDGNVVFSIDGTPQSPVALSGGSAAITVSSLTAGARSIVAAYAGSPTHSASSSAPLQQNVEVRQSTTVLTSSLNPSRFNEAVTFTATVSGGEVAPSGQVVFSIDGVAQPPVAVSGGTATLATSTLSIGSHAIVAAYSGSVVHGPSTSETLTQNVDNAGDSEKLREIQVQMTKMVAQTSGQAISGAIGDAVSDGFSDSGQLMEGSAGMLGFSLVPPQAAEKKTPSSALDGLAGEGRLTDRARAASDTLLGYGGKPLAVSMPNVGEQEPQKWRLWAKIYNTAWNAKPQKADIEGNQINFLAGVGYRLSPDLIVGAFGGYESFDYSSTPLNGRLEGDGWTVGGYLGWKITPALRFDAGIARSELDYDAFAGTATGTFGGERWLLQSGLTGSHAMNGFEIEPSARIYALWEREDAYTDNLGALHDARSFSTARASGGVKVTYPLQGDGYTFSPYLGIYGDYYFSTDDASADLTFEDAVQDGWSARITAGFGLNLDSGAQLSLGGELGGLGDGGAPHGTVKATVRIPF